jgi:hypothetical protein
VNAEELPVKTLEAEGMDVVFGLPGEKNLHFVGAVRLQSNAGNRPRFVRDTFLRVCAAMPLSSGSVSSVV